MNIKKILPTTMWEFMVNYNSSFTIVYNVLVRGVRDKRKLGGGWMWGDNSQHYIWLASYLPLSSGGSPRSGLQLLFFCFYLFFFISSGVFYVEEFHQHCIINLYTHGGFWVTECIFFLWGKGYGRDLFPFHEHDVHIKLTLRN